MKDEHGHEGFSMRQRGKSIRFAFTGLIHAIKTQHNLWIQLAAMGAIILLGIIYPITGTEWALLAFATGLVISAELVNSAIEALTDLVSPGTNPRAGMIKDMAAAAVLIAALSALAIGLIVFIPYFF
ncbi:MAG: diacylglycerol kinase family protein [Bacteroidales bacterium]